MRNFITDVAAHYNKVIFHNFAHAFNVLHCTSIIWNKIDHAKYFDELDLFLLLVGTICHDLDHFGLGNSYFVKSGHPLASTVSGQSVMENYHLHMANKLIDKHDMFHALTPAEFTRSKKTLTELIIPTDLGKHFKILEDFK